MLAELGEPYIHPPGAEDLRAPIICELLQGGLDAGNGSRWKTGGHGIDIVGATVVGALSAQNLGVLRTLRLRECRLGDVDLSGCTMPAVDLVDCDLGRFTAWALRVTGDVALLGCRLRGHLAASGAQVGRFVLRGTSIDGTDTYGRSCDLRRARSVGTLRMEAAPRPDSTAPRPDPAAPDREPTGEPEPVVTLAGSLDATDGHFGGVEITGITFAGRDRNGDSLAVGLAEITGRCRIQAARTAGAVRLSGVTVDGDVWIGGSQLGVNDRNRSLLGESMRVGGDVYLFGSQGGPPRGLGSPFEAAGSIRLSDAKVGSLRLRGVRIAEPDAGGNGLLAERLGVSGDLTIGGDRTDAAVSVEGAVRLSGAQVSGNVVIQHTTIGENPRQRESLYCDGLGVRGFATFGPHLTTASTLRLPGAVIDRHLRIEGIRVLGHNAYQTSIYAESLSVGGRVLLTAAYDPASSVSPPRGTEPEPELDDHFAVAGAVQLVRARLGGLTVRWGVIGGGDLDGDGLVAHAAQVVSDVVFGPRLDVRGAVHLASMTASYVRSDGLTVGANLDHQSIVADSLTVSTDLLLSGPTAVGATDDPGPGSAGPGSAGPGSGATGSDGSGSGPGDLGSAGLLTTEGSVHLNGARIGGRLRLSGASLGPADATGALVADAMHVTGDVLLEAAGRPFSAAGPLRLSGSRIVGDLRITNARITGHTTRNGYSLLGDHLRVTGEVAITGSGAAGSGAAPTVLSGAVRLSDASLGGFQLAGVDVLGTDHGGKSLVLHGTTVEGRMRLGRHLRLAGAVGMGEASMTRLDCHGVDIGPNHEDGVAFAAENLTVRGSARFVGLIIRAGSLRLFGANVASNLLLEGCRLDGIDGHAMSLVLDSARVGGDLAVQDLASSGRLALRGVRVDGELRMVYSDQIRGAVLFGGASARVIRDEWPPSTTSRRWSVPGRNRAPQPLPGPRVDLVGFNYEVIHALAEQGWRHRLRWLESRPTLVAGADGRHSPERTLFHAQPYGHLAAMYRRHGDNASARAVRIAQQQAIDRQIRAGASSATWLRYPARRMLYLTVGYGYRPWRVAWWAAGVMLVMYALLTVAPAGAMIPSERSLSAAANSGALARQAPVAEQCPRAFPCLSRAGYAADVFLPIVDLDQEASWRPSGRGGWGRALVAYQWFAIASGWVLTTIVIAAVTGVVRRDEP
ncbi:MAG: hypothetical protein ACQSGP_10685 [Frankia sp.]